MLGSSSTAERLIRINLAVSLLFVGLLGAAWGLSSSQLALAQAADALTDSVVTVALLWAVRIAEKPADTGHPFGHHGAEPLAALLAAGMATALAAEVVQSAAATLLRGGTPALSPPVTGVFLLRVVLKGAIWVLARREKRQSGTTPALDALNVDARNDVIVSGLAFAGSLLVLWGWPAVDGWVALPLGVWVGLSGIGLARRNVALLMGAAPPSARQDELRTVVRGVEGVVEVIQLRARAQGRWLFVWVEVAADRSLCLELAHGLRARVEAALEIEPDVAEAIVVVSPAGSRPAHPDAKGSIRQNRS